MDDVYKRSLRESGGIYLCGGLDITNDEMSISKHWLISDIRVIERVVYKYLFQINSSAIPEV